MSANIKQSVKNTLLSAHNLVLAINHTGLLETLSNCHYQLPKAYKLAAHYLADFSITQSPATAHRFAAATARASVKFSNTNALPNLICRTIVDDFLIHEASAAHLYLHHGRPDPLRTQSIDKIISPTELPPSMLLKNQSEILETITALTPQSLFAIAADKHSELAPQQLTTVQTILQYTDSTFAICA